MWEFDVENSTAYDWIFDGITFSTIQRYVGPDLSEVSNKNLCIYVRNSLRIFCLIEFEKSKLFGIIDKRGSTFIRDMQLRNLKKRLETTS